MHKRKLKYLIKIGMVLLRYYCLLRQARNKERILAAFLIIPALLLLIPTYNFELTLLQSFLFQAMLVYVALSIFWIVRYHYRLAGINFLIYLLLLFKINSPITNSYQVAQGQEHLKVLQFNLRATNDAYQATIDRVLELSADFVSFQEVSYQWANQLENGLNNDYPYSKVVRNSDESQGIAVFSKYPLIDTQVIIWGETVNIGGKVKIRNEKVNFLALHTRSPTTEIKWTARNEHLIQARDFIQKQAGEFLVLGDFNTVPWDKRLLSFKSTTELKDSRKRLTPTYPAWNPFIAQIPIDYIFHSKGIGCQSLDSVDITSDHKALLGTFGIRGM
ncbi:MAG: endonuclease/exonuclease/phosphatase (EEP) superfamily protein YafD [Roseivirga sp.]|jgi:endonuclease/exonuclease/phosphatase (EEP) superfamily protein YafD